MPDLVDEEDATGSDSDASGASDDSEEPPPLASDVDSEGPPPLASEDDGDGSSDDDTPARPSATSGLKKGAHAASFRPKQGRRTLKRLPRKAACLTTGTVSRAGFLDKKGEANPLAGRNPQERRVSHVFKADFSKPCKEARPDWKAACFFACIPWHMHLCL